MPDTELDIKTIFAGALDLADDAGRAAYLDGACAGSPSARARVEALLAAVERAGSFLERPATIRGEGRPGLPPRSTAVDVTTDPASTMGRAAPRSPDGMSGLAPARLGDFELIRRLGEGAMGIVYEARQLSLNRTVAIKMTRAGLFQGEADLRRFRLEAEAVAHLDHPRIVPIYGVWEHDGCHYFGMKLIPGGSLERRLPEYTAAPRAAARLAAEVARAIQHAHERGILHRDLKPSNILLDEEGRPLVTDFGLAKRSGDDSGLTQSGAIVGTPSYMAPEQASGQTAEITAQTDVYGLGAVLYALLSGRPPFVAGSIIETIEAVRTRSPAPPSRANPRVGRDLETICLKCLEKDPWRRYASAGAVADDLRRWLDGEPIEARPVGAAGRAWMWSRRNPIVSGLLAAMVLLALGTTWQWWRAEGLLLQARREAGGQAIDHALAICDQGDVGRGVLRLAEALKAGPAGAGDLKRAIRANIAAWSRHQTRLTNLLRHEDRIQFVAFSPDGRSAVTASPDGTARLWDAATGDPRGAPLRHDGGIMQAAFSPDSRLVITAGLDWTARLWEVEGGRPVGSPLRHRGPVRSVAFSPDGATVLVGSKDGVAQVWEVATRKPLGEPLRHGGWVEQVAFRPDGKVAITTGQVEGEIRLWDLATGRVVGRPIRYQLGRRDNREVRTFVCSGDGRSVLSTGSSGPRRRKSAQVWDAADGRPQGPALYHDGDIRDLALSRDGSIAATGSNDRTARLWDPRQGRPLCGPLRHQGQVLAVALNPAATLVLTGSEDRTARIWRVPGGEPVGDPLHHPDHVTSVAFRPDGRAALTGCEDGNARLWTFSDPEPAGEPAAGVDLAELPNIARSPDGSTILMGHGDGTAQVRDAATRQAVGPPLRQDYAILSVAISPDGDRLLTGCVDGTAVLWSSRTRKPLGRPLPHRGPVRSVAFSPDGRTLLTGGDRVARFWDAGTARPIGKPLAHDAEVVAVAFDPAGRSALTKAEDGQVRRWDVPAEVTGSDERFALWAEVAIGAEIDANGTVRALDAPAWDAKRDRLRILGGGPRP
ncbi:protein kinase domain-containing protein [Tundrisphaera sp. TA3]|uniref:protein kinase domain-containing protein n=1 Tax=Tundrisphaera sp. TA3 TaxID=3435775 RepID=UPI003EB721BF